MQTMIVGPAAWRCSFADVELALVANWRGFTDDIERTLYSTLNQQSYNVCHLADFGVEYMTRRTAITMPQGRPATLTAAGKAKLQSMSAISLPLEL